MKITYHKFDIAVIGGGAAGMMSAGRAAEKGARVVLLEKNDTLGKKLSITGKGRCNITQDEPDLRELVSAFGQNGKFLFSSFSVFGPEEVKNFFESKGLKLKTERGGRVFPESDNAGDVIRILRNYMRENGVEVMLGVENISFETFGKKIKKIKFKEGEVEAKKYIICTGGKSYPGTGSTGEGYDWAKKLGHGVSALNPALAPIKIKNSWVKDLQGLSLKNVELSVWQNDKKKDSRFGEMLFTHFGISGPIVLDISKTVGELLKTGAVTLGLDLKPALDEEQLDKRVQRDFKEFQNKLFKNSLGDLLPLKMIPLFINISGVDPEKQVNGITREERKKIVNLLKNLPMEPRELVGFDLAVVTTGGVNLKEIDPRTMKSKIIDNLYFAGEILDIDGPTGGYNLQAAWSTGYVAGDQPARMAVIKNMRIKITMEKMVFGGQCLGRFENKVIFVWNALPGEEVEVELTKNKKDFAEGVAVNIIKPSPHRLAPKEDHFMVCSPWQIMTKEEEDRWKKEISLETYVKIGGLPKDTFLDIFSPNTEQYEYRNKMEYSFTIKEGKISLAFFERGQKKHLAIPGCELAEKGINTTAKAILDWINEQNIPLRSLKSLIIRSNNREETIAALFIKDHLSFSSHPKTAKKFLGFQLYYSDHRCPASRPDELLYGCGNDYLMAALKSVKLKYGLLSFFQINIPIFIRALEDISLFLDKNKTVIDYYSGVGAIGLSLAEFCEKVVLVDNNREAIDYAKENIKSNFLEEKCSAELCPAEKIADLIEKDRVIIFDPPRAGLHENIVKKVLEEKPEKIIYLSCNISTHARDIKLLSEFYEVKYLKLYNFFPRTPHVESLCVMIRK